MNNKESSHIQSTDDRMSLNISMPDILENYDPFKNSENWPVIGYIWIASDSASDYCIDFNRGES